MSMPGDFETQSGLLLGMTALVWNHPRVLMRIVDALVDRLPLIGLINGEPHRRELMTMLCDWGLPAQRILCVNSAAVGPWVRDYGPAFVRRDGRIVILDPEYMCKDRGPDDHFPTEFADVLGLDVHPVPLWIEGGNILSSGRGLGLCSTALPQRNAPRFPEGKALQALAVVGQTYGFSRVMSVPPLIGEPSGHLDMFAAFTSPDTIVLGEYSPRHDLENAHRLDNIEKLLLRAETGVPLNVVRIPMPPRTDGAWRTFTNIILANGTVLVPTFEDVDPGMERQALDTFARLLKGWEVIPVECTSLIRKGGALRCVSMNIPDLGRPLKFQGQPIQEPDPSPPLELVGELPAFRF